MQQDEVNNNEQQPALRTFEETLVRKKQIDGQKEPNSDNLDLVPEPVAFNQEDPAPININKALVKAGTKV